MIAPFGMSSVPTGWLACDGSAVSRTTYADLFTAIGTTWGAGDGSSTFALPDLEGAFLRGTGSHNTQNMANGSDYAGPSVGSFESDQNQSHTHVIDTKAGHDNNGTAGGATGWDGVTNTNTNSSGGDEARPFNAGVKYCIKY